jgi:hypothetical protein
MYLAVLLAVAAMAGAKLAAKEVILSLTGLSKHPMGVFFPG